MFRKEEMQLHLALEKLLYRNARRRMACGRPYGLRSLEILTLETLLSCEREGEVTPSVISAKMEMKNPVLSPVLASLEEKGCLQLCRDARDRRRRLVTLTDRGRSMACDFAAKKQQECRGLAAFLGETDTRELTRLLERLNHYAEQQELQKAAAERGEQACSN